VHATVKASRFRLVLAVLLILLGMSPAVAPGANGYSTPVAGDSASVAPSTHYDLHDWLRLSGAAHHTVATALPDNWWAVYTRTVGERTPRGRSAHGAINSEEAAATTPASQPSRAPPTA
jgi:hypothetical protein